MSDQYDERLSVRGDGQQAGDAPDESGLTDEDRAVVAAFQARGPRPSAWRPPVPPTRDDDVGDADRSVDERTAGWQMPSAAGLDDIPPEMKRAFVVEAAEALEGLREWTLRFERGGERAAALELGRIAHRIKGTGATMGFDVLAELMLIYEDVVRAALRRSVAEPHATVHTLLAILAPIEQAVLAAADDRAADLALVLSARRLRDELLGTTLAPAATDFADTADSADISAVPYVGEETLAGLADLADLMDDPDADAVATLPLPVARVEAPLRVDPRRLDDLMSHLSGLTLGRGALLRARDELARMHADFEQMVARVNTLADQLADLRPAVGQVRGAAAGGDGARRVALRLRLFGGAPGQRDSEGSDTSSGADLERFTEFDEAMIALREAVDDLMTTGRTLRDGLRQLGRIGDEQAAVVSSIQDDVLHMRLVPFGDLVPRVEVEARQLAHSLGKSLTLEVSGEMTELDRHISDGLAEPLRQLVRNAVMHGIETPIERREAGKPATGSVWLRAAHLGSEVVIEVGDDGRGVNPHRLAAAAVAAGLVDAGEAQTLSLPRALDLMFWPGLSTYGSASIHGGRGNGLDEVRATIERLRGTISVRLGRKAGTVFRIRVPISLSAVRAIVVRAGGFGYTLPFAAIASTAALQPPELLVSVERDDAGNERRRARIRVAPRQVVESGGELLESAQTWEEIPAEPLAELLGFAQERRDPQPAVIIEAGSRRAALLVDALLGEHDVVVQALPAHLRRRVVRGATVTPDGELLWLLDPAALLDEMEAGRHTLAPRRRAPRAAPDASVAPSVLVVDDSVSIRHALEQTLSRAGFTVTLARDGIEALDLMLARPPRVLLLDIEMPRLDGFELLGIMHGTPALADVRVAVLSSRAAPRHQKRARDLGAAAYLIKPCTQETLIETVQALIAAPVAQG